MTVERSWLDVAYAEKDQAKAAGARWDAAARRWYAPPGREGALEFPGRTRRTGKRGTGGDYGVLATHPSDDVADVVWYLAELSVLEGEVGEWARQCHGLMVARASS
ncbi:DUF5710 domain-containing protein [Streptomyces sp. NBC_01013]|nr:DUF5710 domain-containing protein [Streptomyces sp. NBC_01013]